MSTAAAPPPAAPAPTGTPRRHSVLIDLRGHAGEIFDADYRSLLRDIFVNYGEDNTHIFTDSTPFSTLFATALSSTDPFATVDAFELFVMPGNETPLTPRDRFANDRNVYMAMRNFLVDSREELAALLPPLFRTLSSSRCSGAYLPDNATLKTSLNDFLRRLVERIPPYTPIDFYWASHGNYLECPALDSAHGEYGIVAIRSAREIATIADVSLTAKWIARDVILPLALLLPTSPMLWSFHCCWSSGIIATIELEIAATNGPYNQGAVPSNLSIISEKPARSNLKAAFVALYNDNFPLNPDICKPWGASSPADALKAIIANMRQNEIAITGDRVRLVVERDLKSRAVVFNRPVAIKGDAPVEFFNDGEDLRAKHWPVMNKEPSLKKRLSDWNFSMQNKVELSESDPRFIEAYEAAAEAGCLTLESSSTSSLPLHLAFAAALREAAVVIRQRCMMDSHHPVETALDECQQSGIHESIKEDYWLNIFGSVGESVESVPSGGTKQWDELSSIVNGADRPGFFSRVQRVAHSSAELCIAYASRRLEALALYVSALKPCLDSATLLHGLDYILSLDANTKGEQSGGDIPFVHRVVLQWLFFDNNDDASKSNGMASDLEEVLWNSFAVRAAGGRRALEHFDCDALDELTSFPTEESESKSLRLKTGLLVCGADKKLK